MTDTRTIADVALEAAAYFTTRRRGDESIIVTRDDAPDWITDLVHAAHGDLLPDDWRYRVIFRALEHIAESDAETRDDAHDLAGEFGDGAVDVYNGPRLAWLASHLSRAGYCDAAAAEFGAPDEPDILGAIGLGQYAEASEVYGIVVEQLAERLEALEDLEDPS